MHGKISELYILIPFFKHKQKLNLGILNLSLLSISIINKRATCSLTFDFITILLKNGMFNMYFHNLQIGKLK